MGVDGHEGSFLKMGGVGQGDFDLLERGGEGQGDFLFLQGEFVARDAGDPGQDLFFWGGVGGQDLEVFGVGGFIGGEGGQGPAFLLVGQAAGQDGGPGFSQDVFDFAHGGFFIFSHESLHGALGISQDGCGIIFACFGQRPFFLHASQPAKPLNAKIPEGITFANRLASTSLIASQFGNETCFLHNRFFAFCSEGLQEDFLSCGHSTIGPPLLSQLGLCMFGQGVSGHGGQGMFCKLRE